MKGSIKDPAFPWFPPLDCAAHELRITIDGTVVEGCTAFDTDEGWVEFYRMRNGEVMANDAGEPMTVRQRGKVEVAKR